jgi:hypothetical protein
VASTSPAATAEISAVTAALAPTTPGAIFSVHPFGSHLHGGRGAAFVVLVAFLASFLAIRTSARLTRSVSWWPGGVQSGGVHLHHLVWGICLILLSGFLSFAAPMRAPWWHIDAIAFGIGAGFTLDEFALWVHLQDVYWSEEGRLSVDAVVVAVGFAALVVTGTRPFGLDDPGSIWGTAATVLVVLSLVLLSAAKGHVFLAVLGMFIPIVALVGAIQLAKPTSIWARHRYDEHKLEHARRRYSATSLVGRLGTRISDIVAGAPSEDGPA